VSIFLGLRLVHLVLRSLQIFCCPVGRYLFTAGSNWLTCLAAASNFNSTNAVGVHKVIGFLRRGVEEVHFRHFVGLESLLEFLVREIEPELGRAHRIQGN
jgi:hypothetical protein